MQAKLGDRELSYARSGGGAPLLLIMGLAGHHGLWREDFIALLGRDFDVLSYDHRGIAASTDVPGDFTIADLAEDAIALMDSLGWSRAHVLGISMGGMIAQELVLNHPDRVERLVLGCSYCGGPSSSLDAGGPTRMVTAMMGDGADPIRVAFEANLSPAWTADESHWPEFREITLAERVPVPVVLRQSQAAMAHDAAARLPSITAPTLVIAGTADEMLLVGNSELIASLIPGATLELMPGVGHLFWWERTHECVTTIREHLLG